MTTEPSGSWWRGVKWLIFFFFWLAGPIVQAQQQSQRGGVDEQTESHVSGWKQAGERVESRSTACEDILQGLVQERSSKAEFWSGNPSGTSCICVSKIQTCISLHPDLFSHLQDWKKLYVIYGVHQILVHWSVYILSFKWFGVELHKTGERQI